MGDLWLCAPAGRLAQCDLCGRNPTNTAPRGSHQSWYKARTGLTDCQDFRWDEHAQPPHETPPNGGRTSNE